MATHKAGKFDSVEYNSNQNPLECCDVCGSRDVIETREGYTCRDCGVVLEIQKLEYHRPYDRDIVQHAVLGKTQIGYKRERFSLKNSIRIEGLSKLDSLRTSEESVAVVARVEIKRILTALGFPLTDVDPLLEKFKYKPIREKDLLEVTNISKKDFNAFKFSILRIWPEYKERNRKEYIIQRILEVTEHFDLGMSFFYQSKKILNRFYDNIKNTKDDVIIGLVTSITLLCSQQSNVSISALCNRLDVKMSTIHRQVEKRVMQRFKVSGFKSLVKSADLLKSIMTKLGVLDTAIINTNDKSEVDSESDDLVRVVLGNARPVFNSLGESNDSYLFVRGISGLLGSSIINEKNNDHQNDMHFKDEGNPSHKIEKVDIKDKVKIELFKFYNPKGPPILC